MIKPDNLFAVGVRLFLGTDADAEAVTDDEIHALAMKTAREIPGDSTLYEKIRSVGFRRAVDAGHGSARAEKFLRQWAREDAARIEATTNHRKG